ncbi:hypothetical protein N9X96_00260 [bacterium]|jgi:hypothetical protein|nr:hypothetical protein [bacterium]
MKYSDLNVHIRPEVQGCPDFIIERAVRDAAIDFCRRTDVYIPEPEFVIVIGGVNEYSVTIPTGTELNHIIDIFDNHRALQPISYNELLRRLGDETERGKPAYYSQRDNAEFFVAPIPNDSDSIRVVYSVKPTSTSTSIPDTIGKEYREALVHGALFRLQMMAGHPFTNPNMASVNKNLFEREVGRTTRQVKYGFSGGTLTCKARAFI